MIRCNLQRPPRGGEGFRRAAQPRENRGARIRGLRRARLERLGLHERIEGAIRLLPAVVREAEIVPRPRKLRIELHRFLQRGEGLGEPPQLVQTERQIEAILGLARREPARGFEMADGFRGLSLRIQRERERGLERRRAGVPLDRAAQAGERFGGVAPIRKPLAKLEQTGGLIAVVLEHVPQLTARERLRRDARPQAPRGLDAHIAHGIGKQQLQQARGGGVAGLRGRFEGAGGGGADDGVRVFGNVEQGVGDVRFVTPVAEQVGRGCAPERHFFIRQQPQQIRLGTGTIGTAGGDPLRARARRTVHPRAVPFVHGLDGPVGGAVGVAAVAGVGNAKLLGQQRVGNGEAVVMPGVALHVNGLRHVAIHATPAGFVRRVMTVRRGDDHRRGRDRRRERGRGGGRDGRGMAAEAEEISRQNGLARMRLVAIDTAHARRVHPTAEERGELVVLVAHLAVGIKNVRLVGNREAEVIEEIVAGLEVTREFAPAGVAGTAGGERLIAGVAVGGRVFRTGAAMLFLPVHMRALRAVAGLATDAALGHRGRVGVSVGAIIFADARVVAGGAHRVPVHAAPGPVAPFAGLAVFVAEDIEPVVRARIVGQLGGLPPPAACRNEELPQWIQADHAVGNEGLLAAIKADGDEFEAPGGGARLGRLRAVQNHALRLKGAAVQGGIDGAFRQGVVRIFPAVERGRVAFAATGRAGVGGEGLRLGRDDRRSGRRNLPRITRRRRRRLELPTRDDDHGQRDQARQHGEPNPAA